MTRGANCAPWSFAGKTRPPEEFSTRLLLRIPSDAYKKKKHRYCGVSLFMVHLNRLANKKKLIIAFWSGVRQSKESREPKTCGGEVRRLCDSDVRTRGLTTSVLLKVSFRDMLLGIALCHSFRFLRCSALCSSRRRYRKRYANSPSLRVGSPSPLGTL